MNTAAARGIRRPYIVADAFFKKWVMVPLAFAISANIAWLIDALTISRKLMICMATYHKAPGTGPNLATTMMGSTLVGSPPMRSEA